MVEGEGGRFDGFVCTFSRVGAFLGLSLLLFPWVSERCGRCCTEYLEVVSDDAVWSAWMSQ